MSEYILSGANMTILGTTTLLAFRPPASGRSIMVSEIRVSQSGSSTSQQLSVALQLQASAYPTMVSQTPLPCYRLDAPSVLTGGTLASAGQAGKNASAENAGAVTKLVEEGFNNLSGWLWLPTDDAKCIVIDSGSSLAFGVRLTTAPSVLTGWHATMRFREL